MKRLFLPTFLVTFYATAIAFTPIYISIAKTIQPWQDAFAEGMGLAPGILTLSFVATIFLTPAVYYALRACHKLSPRLKALEEKPREDDIPTHSEDQPTASTLHTNDP